jgi:hypothetical protein
MAARRERPDTFCEEPSASALGLRPTNHWEVPQGRKRISQQRNVFPPGAYLSDPASSLPPYCEMVAIIKIK